MARTREKGLAARAVEKLRDWFADQAVLKITSLAAAVLAGALAGLAVWLDGLLELQRGMLWGAAAVALCEAIALVVAWLWLYLRRRSAASEIEDLVSGVRMVVIVARSIYGPEAEFRRHPELDMEGALRGLQRILVQSTKFTQREKLFEAVNLFDRMRTSEKRDWADLQQHLDRLAAWADYAENRLLLRTPPQEDPLDQIAPYPITL